MKVGILSFQGSFLDHSKSVKAINAKPILIKNKSDIHELDALRTVIVYSHENPPQFKTIVEINALTGKIVTEPYSENINAWKIF